MKFSIRTLKGEFINVDMDIGATVYLYLFLDTRCKRTSKKIKRFKC
jgi:hypothetical protein